MNKITAFLLIIITALGLTLVTTIQSKAQNKSFVGILPFMTNGDRVGFLDQGTGRVYLYDSNMSQCLFIGQIQSLGQPIQVVTASSVNDVNPSSGTINK